MQWFSLICTNFFLFLLRLLFRAGRLPESFQRKSFVDSSLGCSVSCWIFRCFGTGMFLSVGCFHFPVYEVVHMRRLLLTVAECELDGYVFCY